MMMMNSIDKQPSIPPIKISYDSNSISGHAINGGISGKGNGKHLKKTLGNYNMGVDQENSIIDDNATVLQVWLESNQALFSNTTMTTIYISIDSECSRISAVLHSNPYSSVSRTKKNILVYTIVLEGMGRNTRHIRTLFLQPPPINLSPPNSSTPTSSSPNLSSTSLNNSSFGSVSSESSASSLTSNNSSVSSLKDGIGNGSSSSQQQQPPILQFFNNVIQKVSVSPTPNHSDNIQYLLTQSIQKALHSFVNSIQRDRLFYNQVISYKKNEGMYLPTLYLNNSHPIHNHIDNNNNNNVYINNNNNLSNVEVSTSPLFQNLHSLHPSLSPSQLSPLSSSPPNMMIPPSSPTPLSDHLPSSSSEEDLSTSPQSSCSQSPSCSPPIFRPLLSSNSVHNIQPNNPNFLIKKITPVLSNNITLGNKRGQLTSSNQNVQIILPSTSPSLSTINNNNNITPLNINTSNSGDSIPTITIEPSSNESTSLPPSSVPINIISPTTSTNTTQPSLSKTPTSNFSFAKPRAIGLSKELGEKPSMNIYESADKKGVGIISSLYGWDYEKRERSGEPFADSFCITSNTHQNLKATLTIADGSGLGEDPHRAATLAVLGANEYIEKLNSIEINTTNDLLTIIGNAILEGHMRIIDDEFYKNKEIHSEPKGATTFCIGFLGQTKNISMNLQTLNAATKDDKSSSENLMASIKTQQYSRPLPSAPCKSSSVCKSTSLDDIIQQQTTNHPTDGSQSGSNRSLSIKTSSDSITSIGNEEADIAITLPSIDEEPGEESNNKPVLTDSSIIDEFDSIIEQASTPISLIEDYTPFNDNNNNNNDNNNFTNQEKELTISPTITPTTSPSSSTTSIPTIEMINNSGSGINNTSTSSLDSLLRKNGPPNKPLPPPPVNHKSTSPTPAINSNISPSPSPPNVTNVPPIDYPIRKPKPSSAEGQWFFMVGSVGDCRAFRWSSTNKKVTEITNHKPTRNFNDAGGQLGWMWGGDDGFWPLDASEYPKDPRPDLKDSLLRAKNEKSRPHLKNLHFGLIMVNPGDRVFITSDGVTDNFLNMNPLVGEEKKTTKEELEVNMTQFLRTQPPEVLQTCESMSQALITYCLEKTQNFRQIQEEMSRSLVKLKEMEKSGDKDLSSNTTYQQCKKNYSKLVNSLRTIKHGKPDHSSIVMYEA